ncbi:MAG: arginase family protein [Gemmataceae bacterium]|nr:arginase family protein [Gemmataceae bacterium]
MKTSAQTSALFFPFDLFGHSGTRRGAELLADAFQEMLADNKREKLPTRSRAYAAKVRFEEFPLDTPDSYRTWRADARAAIRAVWDRDDFLLWVSGNHLGVLPAYDELASELASRNVLVLQLDAHLDIYNLADCTAELSHGNFLMHVDGRLPPIVNVGHRELLLTPQYIAKYYRQTFSGAELALDPEPALLAVQEACADAEAVFLDIDCDVFDPAYFPAVVHPVPMGLSPQLLVRFLEAAWSPRVVGCAFSEFDPARDRNDVSLSTLMWLIEYLLLRRHERSRNRP